LTEEFVMAIQIFEHCRLALSLGMMAPLARAEVREVSLESNRCPIFALMVMEDLKLVEKHLAASGMSDVQVKWNTLGGQRPR